MQFHILSLEGPDAYARAGGLATRVEGLGEALGSLGYETHLWFVGAPDLPGHESRDSLHVHRWCQWISAYHSGGVYDGEHQKLADYAASLPPFLLEQHLLPHLEAGGHGVVLAEEWHTVGAVLHLDARLREEGRRDRVAIFWNANNTFGFDRVDWARLAEAAVVTTVSRYMKLRMREWGAEALVIPNGLPLGAFEAPRRASVQKLRAWFGDRALLTKMARWDPDKCWLETVRIVAEMKHRGWRPLLLARGGSEAHGHEVLRAAHELGLVVVDRTARTPGAEGLLESLRDAGDADVVNLRSFVDPDARRVLFRGSDAVMANSRHEPFGLVGLETMAVRGIACTGSSGEDYVVPGQNAIVLETSEPREFLQLFGRLRTRRGEAQAMRRAGHATARRFTWLQIAERVLVPRVEPPVEETPLFVPRRARRARCSAVERAAS